MSESSAIVLLKACAFSFARAFLGVFIAGLAGVLASPDWNAGKAALVALSAASLVAGFRALQAVFTQWEPTDRHVN